MRPIFSYSLPFLSVIIINITKYILFFKGFISGLFISIVQINICIIFYYFRKIIINKVEKVCTVGLRVNLTYDDSIGNILECLSDFLMPDPELIDVLLDTYLTKLDASTSNIDQVVSKMLFSVFQ